MATNSENAKWINYIWYNQQRFMNYTIGALEALGQQLDATSRMALQKRFAIDLRRALDNGVYVLFNEQCCSYILMNTGEEGNFTKVMSQLKELRDEHIRNTKGESKDKGWWTWND